MKCKRSMLFLLQRISPMNRVTRIERKTNQCNGMENYRYVEPNETLLKRLITDTIVTIITNERSRFVS